MKAIPVIDVRKILVVVFTLFIAHSSSAQSKIDYSQLKLNDSIRIQTIYGSYYYGFFAGQTDSLLNLQISMISDTLRLAKNQIYELEVLSQQTQVADKKQSPTLPPAPGTDLVVIRPPTAKTMTLQVIVGTAGLFAGAVGGALGGAIIVGGLTRFSSEGSALGVILGGVAGGLITSTSFIQKIGNTKDVKGKFLVTAGGILLGSLVTLPYLAVTYDNALIYLSPFIPALVGTLFYNSSRYIVPKPLGSGLLPPSPFSGPAYGMVGGRPVFQVNLLTLTF